MVDCSLSLPVFVEVFTTPAFAEPYSAPKPPAWKETSSILMLGMLPVRVKLKGSLTFTPST